MTTLQTALQWRKKRAERLKLEKEARALQVEEKALKDQIIAALRNSENKSVSNGERIIQLVPKEEPVVNDWDILYAYIKRTGNFELLYRRLNPAAVKERWEVGAVVPGVAEIEVYDLSDTAAK
jgi:hypothetical protein